MKLLLPIALSFCLLTGCSLIPKPVEFFQKKVQAAPTLTEYAQELGREAAARAKVKSQETVAAALKENSSTNVVNPAIETAKLTDAVSTVLGPPLKPVVTAPTATPEESAAQTDTLVKKLQTQVADLDRQLDVFRKANEKVAGKKIEGTGLISVPYFLYAGGIVLIVIVFWHLAHTALTVASVANPGAAVGVGAMNVTGSLAAKGFSQVVAGGKGFLAWVEKELDPAVKAKVTDAFLASQKQAQDSDVKTLVNTLVK